MDKSEILNAILSKDKDKLIEAKSSIKELLNAEATKFKENATRFIGKSIFEGTAFDSPTGSTKVPYKIPDINGEKGFDPTLDTAMGKDKTGHVFEPGSKATNANTGVVGTLPTDPYNSSNAIAPPASFTADSGKIDTSDMFKDQVPSTDGLDTTIAMLTGMEKGV